MLNCWRFGCFVRLVMIAVITPHWILRANCQVIAAEKFVQAQNPVTLKCTFDKVYQRREWRFKENAITSGDQTTDGRFSTDCPKNSSYCHLTINEATEELAGPYQCMASDLTSSLNVKMSYQLVVGGLDCTSNINDNQHLTAESDCQGPVATKLMINCTFNYKGNFSHFPLKWLHKWTNGSLVERSTVQPGEPVKLGNKASITGSISATREMADQYFECFIENQPDILSCTLKRPNIMYAFNSILETIDSSRDVTCQANKSQNTHCKYSWHYRQDGSNIERQGSTLSASQMSSPGHYRCIAKCSIGGHQCSILARDLQLIKSDESASSTTSNTTIGVIIAIVAILVVIVLAVTIICYIRKKKSKEKTAGKGSEDLKEVKVDLLPKNEEPKVSISTTPAPQPLTQNGAGSSGTGAGPSQRKPSFKRFHSKGSQEFQKIIEEENPESPSDGSGNIIVTTQIGKEIPLNDSTGCVSGVCHFGGRIYCVTKGCAKLFIFSDSPPYNRMMPEEIVIRGLSNPQSLVACRKPEHPSIYINDYGGTVVFRVFPKRKEDGNKTCQGKIDGNPAYLALARPDTLVVTLKRDQKMHTEVYDTSRSFDKDGSVSETQTWEKKYILPHPGDVTLPLGICVSGCPLEGIDVNSRGSQKLYLLYGSGRYIKTSSEFSSYKIAKLDIETGRSFVTFDLKDLSKGGPEKFVPVTVAADESEGGIFVLEANKGQLVHLNSDLARFVFDVRVGVKIQSVCIRSKERIAIFGNCGKKLFLVCHKIKHGAPVS